MIHYHKFFIRFFFRSDVFDVQFWYFSVIFQTKIFQKKYKLMNSHVLTKLNITYDEDLKFGLDDTM